ncbi:MAG TPA: hypothetical protein VK881_03540, partial [bacterium]|nr:hypothetical protein [bacterium]
RSLYSHDLATFGRSTGYNQGDAAGFIRLFGLPAKVFAEINPELVRDLPPGVRGDPERARGGGEDGPRPAVPGPGRRSAPRP